MVMRSQARNGLEHVWCVFQQLPQSTTANQDVCIIRISGAQTPTVQSAFYFGIAITLIADLRMIQHWARH